jgi:integrase
MAKPSPSTLTRSDQLALLDAASSRPREALLVSLALGTGLRLAELVGLDVGDIYLPGGQPRVRVRLRPEIAKRGRAGDVFLPDGLKPKLERFWNYKRAQGERLEPENPLFCTIPNFFATCSPVRPSLAARPGSSPSRRICNA